MTGTKTQIAYVPIGVGTFHLESAQRLFEQSADLIRTCAGASGAEARIPEKMLLTLQDLNDFLKTISPDLIIMQNVTFANAAYAGEVLRNFSAHILLWTLREPVIDGGRLRLNSLTGAFSAGNAIKEFRGSDHQFEYVFGSPDEQKVHDAVNSTIRACCLRSALRSAKISAVGHTPQGFGFGRALDAELTRTFGAVLESIEARELINKAKSYSQEECSEYLERAKRFLVGLENTPKKNTDDFVRLYKAYDTYVRENNISALASRCWPDFFTDFGTPVCAVLSLLNAEGVVASCESDTYGALSMFMCAYLTKTAAFFGDPVSMDEEEGTITFWHCGMGACSLARKDTGAEVGVHCNRKIGPTLEFGCRASGEATIFRVGRKPNGQFRFFIAEGEILDKPKQFSGTSLVVRTKGSAEKIIMDAVKSGWEPHFAVAYGSISKELSVLARMLGTEVCEF